MLDQKETIERLKTIVSQFVDEREWQKFHDPKNLGSCILLEAAELLEHFQWRTCQDSYKAIEENRTEITKEIADIFISLFHLCRIMKVDVTTAVIDKIDELKKRYPADKCKGSIDSILALKK